MALLGLKAKDALPSGGYSLVVTVQPASATADTWTTVFAPVFAARCGITLDPGSLSLWAGNNMSWDRPRELSMDGGVGEFCPVILEEKAVGVAYRINRQAPRYLEIVSSVPLRDRLGLKDGQRIEVRLLPGVALSSCLAGG